MPSTPPLWIILPVMLLAGCDQDVMVIPNASKAESRELTPVEFDTLEFIHDTLADRLQRIDRLARTVGLPDENTIAWSRRPPNANDARKLHSYVAQWSTHRMRFGDAIQPDQRPGQKISVIAEVNPGDTRTLCGLHLFADWKSKEEGWNASILMRSFRSYQRDSVGEERLMIWLEHTDGIHRVSWPFSDWGAEVPTERQADRVVAIQAVCQPRNLEQTAALLASPVSFLNGMRRELDAMERRVLDDIAASRHVRLGRYHYTTSIPDPSRMEFRDIEVPAGFELNAREKQAFTANLTDWIQSRRKLFEEDHEEIHAAITKAFPIDEYYAAEANARAPVGEPRN